MLLEEFSDVKNVIEYSEHFLSTLTITSKKMCLKYKWVAALYSPIHLGCCMGEEEYVSCFFTQGYSRRNSGISCF
jgi:hypothetical protein